MPENYQELGYNEDCDEFAIYCSPGCGMIGPYVDGVWNCDEPTEAAEFQELLPKVVEAWNRRAPQPAPTEALRSSGDSDRWEALKAWAIEQDRPIRGELDYHAGAVILRKMKELEADSLSSSKQTVEGGSTKERGK
jgi:hypothetical protein